MRNKAQVLKIARVDTVLDIQSESFDNEFLQCELWFRSEYFSTNICEFVYFKKMASNIANIIQVQRNSMFIVINNKESSNKGWKDLLDVIRTKW